MLRSEQDGFTSLFRLLVGIYHRDLDQRLGKTDEKRCFVVDSDIVRFYATPRRVPHQIAGFSGNPEQAEAISSWMLRYLFDRRMLGDPNIASDHLVECLRFAAVLLSKARTEIADARSAVDHLSVRQQSELQSLLSGTPGSRIPTLDDRQVATLLRLLSDGLTKELSSLAQLRRIKQLLSEVLKPLPYSETQSDIRAVWPQLTDLNERECIKTWLVRVQRARYKRRRGYDKRRDANDNSDARVLAALQLANERLQNEQERARFILITGSPTMHLAASGVDPHYAYCKEEFSDLSFADLYLRTPSYLLADPELWASVEGDNNARIDLSRLADGLLPIPPNDRRAAGIYRTYLYFDDAFANRDPRKTARRVMYFLRQAAKREGMYCGSFVDIMKRAERTVRKTGNLLGRSATLHDARDQMEVNANEALERLASVIGPASAPDAVKRRIFELLDRIEQAVDVELMWFVLETTFENLSRSRPDTDYAIRNVPYVDFGKFTEAAHFSEALRHAHLGTDRQLELLRNARNKLQEEDRSESQYTLLLVYALAFTAMSDWALAADTARYAWASARAWQRKLRQEPASHDIADDKARQVIGEEAAYLAAVAIRHISKSAGELEEARGLLVAAQEIRPGEPRFQAELWALEMTRWSVAYFSGQEPVSDRVDVRHIPNFLQKAFQDLSHVDDRTTHASLEHAREQILTNLFLAVLMLLFDCHGNRRMSLAEVSRGIDVEGLLEAWSQCIEAQRKEGKRISGLVRSAFLIATYLFVPEKYGWNEQRRRGEMFGEIYAVSLRRGTMPYDLQRIRLFLHILTTNESDLKALLQQLEQSNES